MKKKFILFPLIAVLFYVILSSNASGPGAGSVPTDATTGGCSCHNGSSTSTTVVNIQLKNGTTPVTTYIPGNTYTITLTGTQTDGSLTLSKFGFQTEVVNSGGSTAGTLTAPTGTHTVSPAGVVLVEHSSPLLPSSGTGGSGTTYVVNIPWTAPSSGAGGLTLKGVLNAVNANGSNDPGDKWNNTTSAVNELLATTGSIPVCVGSTITLSNSTTGGGTWSTASGAVSISGTSGSSAVITGISAATATVTYTAGGNIATTVVTVNGIPTVTGTPTACVGGTTTLNPTPTGGTWLSGAPGTATVSPAGVVTGIAGGSAAITYTALTGCQKVTTVNIIAVPPITGTMIVCEGSTTALSNSASGGTWISGTGSVASVGLSSGIVTGILAGTTTITYTAPSGCPTTTVVTVNTTPAAIGGTLSICTGTATTLTNTVGGGTWTSSDGSRATIGPSSGIVNGVAAGTSTISYSLSTGCRATAIMTVNQTPSAISGAGSVCTGLTTTLSNGFAGGTWTSSDGSVAAVGSSTGIVSGGAVGTATITYTLSGGCFATMVETVTALPAAITGIMSICPSTTSTLSSTSTGGTWSSSASSIATIGSASGVLSGVAAGTADITYSLSAGCNSTATITVNPTPSVITGVATVCVGSTTSLSSATTGGTWGSSNANASIDITTGVVTGMAAGTSVITYTASTGCNTTTIVTVYPVPAAISGIGTMCVGLTTTLTNSTGGGTWSSSPTGVATIGVTSGISMGISAGTATVSYTLGTGCYSTTTVTVNPLPGAITGGPAVCVGSTITLADGTPGGTWSSTSGAVTVDASTGAVTGISANTATVTYTLPTSCRATTTVTVNPLPAALTGANTVCVGTTATVTAPTGGGTWFSSNTSAATISGVGVISGIAVGTTTISYTLPTSCMTTIVATVNPLPGATTGTAVVCVGSTTALSNGTPGGSWSSSSGSVATVNASGVVSGVASGTTTITYMLPTGCIATTVVTVNPLPNAGVISGPATLCAGSTTTLSNTASGGAWSSSPGSVATVSSTGVVSGVSTGTVTISYTASNSCGTAIATKVMTITLTASAGTISGPGTVCTGGTSTLSSTAGGGTWISSNAAVASVVSGTGVVSGVTSGTVLISYSVTGGCGSAVATTIMTVNPSPAAISGPSVVCEASSITLTDAGGGTWASSDNTIATVGSSTGIVSGAFMGTATITYSLSTGCTATKSITVNPIPAPISGIFNTCLGTTTTLVDPTPGGSWSSSNTTIAFVGSSSGVVTGLAAGTSIISYTLPTSCAVTAPITINVTPAPITGTAHACVGTSTTLANATTGGTWASSNVLVATAAGTSGVITGTSAGTTTITYELPTGCFRTVVLTVDATPGPISGATSVCSGRQINLTNTDPGGSWSSSNTSAATVGSLSGIVTGVALGTTIISYTMPTGCSSLLPIAVNSSPAAITGSPSVCMGSATTLASATSGGTWSSSNASVAAVVTISGVVVPISLGTATISYTISNGCSATLPVTVNPVPPSIVGSGTVCAGLSTTLTDGAAGGTWASSTPSVAVISTTSGAVLGVTAGTSMITYTLATGCNTTTIMTVNAAPGPITGGGSLCVGTTATLGNSVPGGTWASSNTAVATVGTVTGLLSGVGAGSVTITYALPTGCRITALMTVNTMPLAIAGPTSVCQGATITLTNPTTGGSWSSSATGIATVGSLTGVVTGVAAGVANITYATAGGCNVSQSITVNPLPVAGTITGLTSVCAGSTITLSNPIPGGVWSASNGHATVDTGIVTGVTSGLDTIMYSVTNLCGTSTASHAVLVNDMPNAGTISGVLNLCIGGSTVLSTSGSFGSWSVSNGHASISTGGILSGISAGLDTVSYTVTNACGTAASTATVTILAPANAGSVSGADSVCPGSTIHLSNAATGGIWAASNTNATVSATGDVTGMLPGAVTIMYIVSNACNVDTASHTVLVKTAVQCVNAVQPSAVASEMLSIYPNPSTGSFVIELPASVHGGQVTVADVTGRIVSQYNVPDNGGNMVITMPDVAPGSYFVRVDSEGRSFRQKVVIVR